MRKLERLILNHIPETLRKTIRHTFVPDEANLIFKALEFHSSSNIMIDVGACVGDAFSNFATKGWTIYAFEPDPLNRKQLTQRWTAFNSVSIDRRAVANQIRADVPFYHSELSAGISGLSSFHSSHRKSGTVDTITLKAFCEEKQIREIDFLKVDTEGYDLFVLQGMPWGEIAPRIVMCEFEDSKTVPLGYSFYDLANYLSNLNYNVLVSEWYPIARYGEIHRWRRFVPYPCTPLNPKAWGNIIAIRDQSDHQRLLSLSQRLSHFWRLGTKAQRLLRNETVPFS